MGITVTPVEGALPAPPPPVVHIPEARDPEPAPRVTALGSLREKRQRMVDGLYIDLKVPRWEDPEIFVRYRPVESDRLEDISARHPLTKKGSGFQTNIDLLLHHCVGIFACLDGDHSQKYSLNAVRVCGEDADEAELLRVPWTRFDPDLREALGLLAAEAPGPSDVCRKLYVTDGDLINAVAALLDFSGYTAERLNEDFLKP